MNHGTEHYICAAQSLIRGEKLTIPRLGIREWMPPGVIDRPNGNTDYLIMLFHTEAAVHLGGKWQEVPPRTLMIWEPGEVHRYGSEDARWCHSWVHAGGSVPERELAEAQIAPNCPFRLGDPRIVDEFLTDLHRELALQRFPSTEIAGSMLRLFLLRLARQPHPSDGDTDPVTQVKDYIDAHFREPLHLPDLASRACLSVPRFCTLFKQCTGHSPIEYAITLRMHQAAYLLRDLNKSVAQAGREVGYDDGYYFSRLFKKNRGVSPRTYRRSLGTRPQDSPSGNKGARE